MALPDQEVKKEVYTQTELDHIVARKVMSHRMDDFERRMLKFESAISSVFERLGSVERLTAAQWAKTTGALTVVMIIISLVGPAILKSITG